jgi:hypothetical protein
MTSKSRCFMPVLGMLLWWWTFWRSSLDLSEIQFLGWGLLHPQSSESKSVLSFSDMLFKMQIATVKGKCLFWLVWAHGWGQRAHWLFLVIWVMEITASMLIASQDWPCGKVLLTKTIENRPWLLISTSLLFSLQLLRAHWMPTVILGNKDQTNKKSYSLPGRQ